MRQRLGLIVIFAMVVTILTTHVARAEVYIDIYGSYGLPGNNPTPVIRPRNALVDTLNVDLEAILRDVELDPFLSDCPKNNL